MSRITYTPIGVIRSSHRRPEETPIQPVFAEGCLGQADIDPAWTDALSDLDGFSHIYLVYHFDRAGSAVKRTKPFLQDVERGVFATRSPRRPNPIGISIVRLLRREANILFLADVDILDGTPLLDIKPYAARFDRIDNTRNGWQDEVSEDTARIRGKRGYRGTS